MKQTYNLFGSLMKCILMMLLLCSTSWAHVDTGGNATTQNHSKQVIGYITNWDAWKNTNAGVPAQGALTHLNIDFNKYTILNYSFFGVAKDGSLHSGDHRNKNIYMEGSVQEPADLFYTDIYSSWDLHILFGEIEPLQYINEDAARRCEAQGFRVTVGGSTWEQPAWGLSGSLPVPLHKETGAQGLLEQAHDKGVKVVASIGGWSMCKHFREMAADPVKRQRFIADCKKLINTGFDGIDLDWEYPGPYSGMNFTGTNADFGNFLILVKEIRQAIGSDRLLTSCFSADDKKLQGFDWAQLANNLDYMNFMTYDFNGGWSSISGINSNIGDYPGSESPSFNWDHLLTSISALNIPKSKICFGAPLYGRGVVCDRSAELNVPTKKSSVFVQPDGPITTAADYTNWPLDVYDGTPNYFFIKQKALAAGSGWVRHWNVSAMAPYLTKDNYFLSYDDEESIDHKARFIVDNELAGVIIWTVYGDLELGGTVTHYGTKLKQWSNVKSPLVNKINEVFASSGSDDLVADAHGPYTAITGETITFSASARGGKSPYNFSWNFGDTTTGTGKNPVHAYTSTGVYSIVLTVVDSDGTIDTAQTSATITSDSDDDGDDDDNDPNLCPGIPSWDSGSVYTGGNEVKHNGTKYRAKWWTQGEEPGTTGQWGVWEDKGTCGTDNGDDGDNGDDNGDDGDDNGNDNDSNQCPGIISWDSGSVYIGGNEVKHDGTKYRAKWWTQGEEPGTTGQWGVWESLGSCGNSDDGDNDDDDNDDGNDDGNDNGDKSFKVVGYMPSWQGSVNDIQYNALTHINYSFLLPYASGDLHAIENAEKLRQLVSKAHAASVKVCIAVGGWNDGNDSAFEQLAANAGSRTNFVNKMVAFVNDFNLDGVDIDWEYPDPGNSANNYALMMDELGNALHSKGKILTAAVVSYGYNAQAIVNDVFDDVDFLNIMAYDGGDGAAHSPYEYAADSVNYWLGRGLPQSKTVIGVPFYGRPGWETYAAIVARDPQAPYKDMSGNAYYNGIDTIKKKTVMALDKAGGIMMWELSQDTHDHTSLLKAINDVVTNN